MEEQKKERVRVWSFSEAENLKMALEERNRLKGKIQEAINLIEFHKNLLGEEYLRNKLINILKR